MTDGTAKIGKGAENTGGSAQNGSNINPEGGVAGAMKAPSNIDGAKSAASTIATPPK